MTINEDRLSLLSQALNIDLEALKTRYYGDCIAKTLYENKCTNETLTVAEEILEYYKTSEAKQGSLNF
jgi:hypothetical protein